jgi:hypothetical protein
MDGWMKEKERARATHTHTQTDTQGVEGKGQVEDRHWGESGEGWALGLQDSRVVGSGGDLLAVTHTHTRGGGGNLLAVWDLVQLHLGHS